MAKTVSAAPSAKRKNSSQHKAPAASPKPAAPASKSAERTSLKRYEVPADFQESEAPLRMQTGMSTADTSKELWLFQLPHELDPTEDLTWQLSRTAGGALGGTCQDSEGVSYTLTEEPSGMAMQLYTTPTAGSNTLSQFKRRVTVVRASQLPDAIAAAEAVEAVMPSADMPGIPSTTQPHTEEAAPPPVQSIANSTVQRQQQQQEQQAGQDTLATPNDSKQQRKKAKSEAKKLKKRAQEHTAINEKQSKLQRQSDTPVLASEALQVSAAPEVKSEAAQLQDNIDASMPSVSAGVPASTEAKRHKKDKKDSKDKDKDGRQHKTLKS